MEKTTNPLQLVTEFHTLFEHPILETPHIPNQDRVDLRMSLINEEFMELHEAIKKGDLKEVADAFCDLQYVLSGAILEFGMGEKFDEMFAEVHRSNMSKSCATVEEAKETIHAYAVEGTECYYTERGGRYFVYRTSDQKTLKSIKYSKADLNPILEK